MCVSTVPPTHLLYHFLDCFATMQSSKMQKPNLSSKQTSSGSFHLFCCFGKKVRGTLIMNFQNLSRLEKARGTLTASKKANVTQCVMNLQNLVVWKKSRGDPCIYFV